MKAIDLVEKKDVPQHDAFVYAASLACYVTPLNLEKFAAVWKSMQNKRVAPNSEVLTVVLLMLTKSNATDELLRVLKEMPKLYGFKRQKGHFVLAMKHCVGVRRFTDAIEVFRMAQAELAASPMCYELALHAATMTKFFTFGIQILRQMFHEQQSKATSNKPTAATNFDKAINEAIVKQFIRCARKSDQAKNLLSALEGIAAAADEDTRALFAITEEHKKEETRQKLSDQKADRPTGHTGRPSERKADA